MSIEVTWNYSLLLIYSLLQGFIFGLAEFLMKSFDIKSKFFPIALYIVFVSSVFKLS